MPTARAAAPSLALRAALAIALTVAFYALALGLAGVLLWIAWAVATSGESAAFRLVLVCAFGGILILYSVFPRGERFEAPGPRLDPRSQPRLFAELRGIASEAGQSMPEEVYLVPDLNAGVLERGGFLGTGGRRVMVLGLPLLAALRVPEFRAVLAHEFGHYHGGETRIGPWIHRTQSAIGRTVNSLTQAESFLRFVFIAYGKAFLRITHAVSRRQELAADALAAGIAGAPALAEGLRRVHGAAPAFDAYFQGELVPILSSGFRPPIAEGFHRFLRGEDISKAVDGLVEEASRQERGNPYDSHPPLRERLAALGNPAPPAGGSGGATAASLLEDLDGLEGALLEAAFPNAPKRLPAVRWEEAGEKVYVPLWTRMVSENRDLVAGLTPATLAAALSKPAGDSRWRRRVEEEAPVDSGPPKKARVAGCALALALLRRGWKLQCEPGKDISLARDGAKFAPFREVFALAEGETTADGWLRRCAELGIADVPLAGTPAPGA